MPFIGAAHIELLPQTRPERRDLDSLDDDDGNRTFGRSAQSSF